MERYKILYEDQDVLVIHKYPGLAVQSARSMTPDLGEHAQEPCVGAG